MSPRSPPSWRCIGSATRSRLSRDDVDAVQATARGFGRFFGLPDVEGGGTRPTSSSRTPPFGPD